eukprot:2293847-Rhodomonas_salina.1
MFQVRATSCACLAREHRSSSAPRVLRAEGGGVGSARACGTEGAGSEVLSARIVVGAGAGGDATLPARGHGRSVT